MDTLRLTLLTPTKKIFEGVEVSEIKIPAEKGEITIFPDHSPLVTTLDTGVLSYRLKSSNEMSKAVLTWGYCEVIDGEVHLLAETAETVESINADEAREVKKNAEKALASNELTPKEISKHQQLLKEAEAKLSILGID